jgi:hypothetical protein
LNCCSIAAPGVAPTISSAFCDGAGHALGGRREHDLGAEQRQHLAALDRHALRHGQDQAIAARGADEGQRDAGVAGGRLDQHGAGLERPSASAAAPWPGRCGP